MAFMLKEATRVLFNVSRRGWGRILPVHANQQQCLYHSHNTWNKLYYFRSICSNHDSSPIEQVVESTRTTTPLRQFAPFQDIKKDLISNFDTSRAIEVVSDLRNKEYASINYVIDAVVTYLTSGEDNRGEEAITFLKGIENSENNIQIFPPTYNKLLKHLYLHEMNDQFFALVQFMQDNGTEPNVHHSYQLLKMANRVGNAKLAQLCFDKIIGCDELFPNKGPVYSNLIYAYSNKARQNDDSNYGMVIKWYNKMMEAGFEPSRSVHVLAIRSYLRSGDDDGAKSVVEKQGGDDLTFVLKYESAKQAIFLCSASGDYEGMKQIIENEDGRVKDTLINLIRTRTRFYEKIYE